jgi:tetratricopeptide (TPR) repeat protein
MTPADRAAAQSALDSGRDTYARLDQIRGPEDAAADLVELWGATESAMKAMLGGSSLTGQTLVRELRQRGLITLDQANALASFWDARSRVDDVQYRPTLTDIGYARVGFNQLSDAVANPVQSSAPISAPSSGQPGASTPPQSIEMPMYEPRGPVGRVPGRKFPVLLVGGVVLAVLVVGGLIYALFFGQASYNRQMADAVRLMQTGQVEAARADFQKISAEHADRVEPHVFLSRLARNDGDMATARNELITAIKIDPKNPLPQREMGLLLLSSDNPDLARSFLIRAVRLAPTDSAAQGYLGCAMMRLNRVEEAQNFLSRAGPGAWSSCAAAATAARPNS